MVNPNMWTVKTASRYGRQLHKLLLLAAVDKLERKGGGLSMWDFSFTGVKTVRNS
jgi:hypothetical protein